MITKYGVNTRSVRKNGPLVKDGVAKKRARKILTCPNCGAMLEKSCPSDLACELSTAKCPSCGAEVR